MCNISAVDWLKEIEASYPVEKIRAGGFPIWQLLRNDYARAFYEKVELGGVSAEPKGKTIKQRLARLRSLSIMLANVFWQIGNFLYKPRYVLFTDVLESRIIEGRLSDKIAHRLIQLMEDDLIVVLNPLGQRHRNVRDYSHSLFFSEMIFRLLGKLNRGSHSIENRDILEEIERSQGIHVPYENRVNDFLAYAGAVEKYFACVRPKLVLVDCYYGSLHQAVIHAAHRLGILTVELQHGIINDRTFAYSPSRDFGRESYPDYILTFGAHVRPFLSPFFIDPARVCEIGSFYLEHVESNLSRNEKLRKYFENLRKGGGKVVCITSQWTVEEELITFAKQVAAGRPRDHFFFIPRVFDKDYEKAYGFPPNMVVNQDFDFYQYASQCDFHATVYSTCALEAPFFGTPNIMINLRNLSRYHYAKILTDDGVARFADTPETMQELIETWEPLPREAVKERGGYFYKRDHRANVIEALKKIGLNKYV